MSVVDDVQRKLFEARCREQGSGPQLRASTMTHVAWAPPVWLDRGRRVLAALEERHPARTIILVPEPRGATRVDARVLVRDFDAPDGREILSEVVELRLHGASARHPGSLVLPLLISDLPAFCRWRGEPGWGGTALAELVAACDRLVVDSSEWPAPARRYARLAKLFDTVAVSDLAWRRGLRWRAALAERWPEIRRMQRLTVEGPTADAELLAGWLRSRLRRRIAFTHRPGTSLVAVEVDGERVPRPAVPRLRASEQLSAELDRLTRDPVYEAAVLAVSRATRAASRGGARSTRPRSPRRTAARRRSR
ncbi:MAG TPA: glucose-6-phosphate dehydrogenase assembly protein OpcA [Gaiella sp.]|nr:glucose-6-phosphate dehydrogenase assembly protein OpcA [Gaiella sp.]